MQRLRLSHESSDSSPRAAYPGSGVKVLYLIEGMGSVCACLLTCEEGMETPPCSRRAFQTEEEQRPASEMGAVLGGGNREESVEEGGGAGRRLGHAKVGLYLQGTRGTCLESLLPCRDVLWPGPAQDSEPALLCRVHVCPLPAFSPLVWSPTDALLMDVFSLWLCQYPWFGYIRPAGLGVMLLLFWVACSVSALMHFVLILSLNTERAILCPLSSGFPWCLSPVLIVVISSATPDFAGHDI